MTTKKEYEGQREEAAPQEGAMHDGFDKIRRRTGMPSYRRGKTLEIFVEDKTIDETMSLFDPNRDIPGSGNGSKEEQT